MDTRESCREMTDSSLSDGSLNSLWELAATRGAEETRTAALPRVKNTSSHIGVKVTAHFE
jgi:hypothetical protein